jgi:hypothetical protein
MESRQAARTFRDFILYNLMDSPFYPALFSLNMIPGADFGLACSEHQLMDMRRKPV